MSIKIERWQIAALIAMLAIFAFSVYLGLYILPNVSITI